jgi:hypothetical protein
MSLMMVNGEDNKIISFPSLMRLSRAYAWGLGFWLNIIKKVWARIN